MAEMGSQLAVLSAMSLLRHDTGVKQDAVL
jgi:hypothetical protein